MRNISLFSLILSNVHTISPFFNTISSSKFNVDSSKIQFLFSSFGRFDQIKISKTYFDHLLSTPIVLESSEFKNKIFSNELKLVNDQENIISGCTFRNINVPDGHGVYSNTGNLTIYCCEFSNCIFYYTEDTSRTSSCIFFSGSYLRAFLSTFDNCSSVLVTNNDTLLNTKVSFYENIITHCSGLNNSNPLFALDSTNIMLQTINITRMESSKSIIWTNEHCIVEISKCTVYANEATAVYYIYNTVEQIVEYVNIISNVVKRVFRINNSLTIKNSFISGNTFEEFVSMFPDSPTSIEIKMSNCVIDTDNMSTEIKTSGCRKPNENEAPVNYEFTQKDEVCSTLTKESESKHLVILYSVIGAGFTILVSALCYLIYFTRKQRFEIEDMRSKLTDVMIAEDE